MNGRPSDAGDEAGLLPPAYAQTAPDLNALVRHYWPLLVRFIERRFPSLAVDSEDIAQVALLRVVLRLGRITSRGLRSYLLRTAFRLAIDHRRRKRPWRFGEGEESRLPSRKTAPADRELLERILSQISTRDRAVLRAVYLDGRAVAALAEQEGCCQKTIRRRVKKALTSCRFLATRRYAAA